MCKKKGEWTELTAQFHHSNLLSPFEKHDELLGIVGVGDLTLIWFMNPVPTLGEGGRGGTGGVEAGFESRAGTIGQEG
jgi:hypothetical protein